MNNDLTKLKVIDNIRKFSDMEYNKQIDLMLDIYNITKKVIYIHSLPVAPVPEDMDPSEMTNFTDDEARSFNYSDDLDSLDWNNVNKLIIDSSNNIYFNCGGISDLLINTLESIKFALMKMQVNYGWGRPIGYEENYRSILDTAFKNLNYCLMCVLKIFDLKSGSILLCLKYYSVMRNVDVISLADEMYDFYTNNRPTLPLFEKYPELAVALEHNIDKDYFTDLIQYSSLLSHTELLDIAENKLEVNEIFIDRLEERYKSLTEGGLLCND